VSDGPCRSPACSRICSYGEFNNEFLAVVANADGSRQRVLLRDAFGPVWSADDGFVAACRRMRTCARTSERRAR
jgi:hypothetical protein